MDSEERTITYLEMRAKPESVSLPPLHGAVRIEQVSRPPVPFYRDMYQAVGGKWNWSERKKIPDSQLREIIQNPDIAILVLRCDGRIIGFAELDHRRRPEIELKYFGLLEEYIGKGYGRYFLNRIIDWSWQSTPSRLWLHTCDRDHPGALAFYQKSGFSVCNMETKDAAEKSSGSQPSN